MTSCRLVVKLFLSNFFFKAFFLFFKLLQHITCQTCLLLFHHIIPINKIRNVSFRTCLVENILGMFIYLLFFVVYIETLDHTTLHTTNINMFKSSKKIFLLKQLLQKRTSLKFFWTVIQATDLLKYFLFFLNPCWSSQAEKQLGKSIDWKKKSIKFFYF